MDMFAADVKQSKYNKLDYNKWRSLRDATPEEWEINVQSELSASKRNPVKMVVSWQHCIAPYEFSIDDNSFGKFLYDLLNPYLNSSYSVDTDTVSNAMTEMAKSANTATMSISSLKETWDSLKTNYYSTTTTWDRAYPDINMEVKQDNFYIDGKSITEIVNEIIDDATGAITRKENDSMNLFKNFDFGSCENDNVKMSMYGIAVKNANGTWVSYDAKSENVVDVDILNFDAKYLYKMPVAIKDVKVGDTIIHCRKPVFVTKNENGKILCVDPAAAEEKIVLPVKNIFGFDFVVKIVNLFDGMNGFEAPSADQPFGNNLWMFMMLEDKGSMSDLLPLMLLSNNGNNFNPLMLLALSNDKTSSNDLLPLLLLSQTNTFGQTK